ncbi:uncharacterized protein [Rutidosis leptorrhynchoides]|uniref:uncharacterized protein isoform X2 n=1 Tax=Rutidosis leptorrhynchoides TaxID=125765 RepID=UPI003A99DF6D
MGFNETDAFLQLVNQLKSYSNIPEDLVSSLGYYNMSINLLSQQDKFSKPMPWIGLYVASASVLCILAMVADLIHGFRNRKLWFPNKYFSLNAASLSVIAVAMKLPVDLSSVMPGVVDKSAKYASMAFMCTMMANLLPSLATMDNKSLVSNIIGLGILVITLVVNICIQMGTGLLPKLVHQVSPGAFYVANLLFLLMIHTCLALAIPTSKMALEEMYEEVYDHFLMDKQREILNVEKLKQHVRNCWIMAETGSPRFMAAFSFTSSASGVICLSIILLTCSYMRDLIYHLRDYKSDYRWSMVVILMVQLFGVLSASIAPLCRCLAALSNNFSESLNDSTTIGVSNFYWINTLDDLKKTSTPYPFHASKYKIIVHILKIPILNICVRIQMLVVSVYEPNQTEETEDPTLFVLRIDYYVEPRETTVKRITQSLNRLIQKVQKKQPNNLTTLIRVSRGFEGVGNYENNHIPSLMPREYLDCWSLPLITLTTIAISLPNIQKNMVDRLLRGVSEGLAYVALVEESLHAMDDVDSVRVKEEARRLWLEVVKDHKWLENKLASPDPTTDSAAQVLHYWKNAAIYHISHENSANSMYRITETILRFYNTSIYHISHEDLFARLSSMISDILAACLTNLPRVIVMKCHTSETEKREASVHDAAQLLAETIEIISILQARALPESLALDDLPFIDKWRESLNPNP